MKIKSLEAIPLRAELTKPFRFANITRTVSANVILRIETSDGLVGWGEACPVPQLTAESQASIVSLVNSHIAPMLVGHNALRREELTRLIKRTTYAIDFTLAAIDTALLDIAGKAAGLPISELLGGRLRDSVEVHGSVGWEQDADKQAENAALAAKEFRWLKLYAGRDTLEADLERIEITRERIGPSHPFLLDTNGLWSVTDVARAAPRLAAADVRLIEQPVRADDHRGNLQARKILVDGHGIDVAADESIRSSSDVAAVAGWGAASVINVGLSKLGGISAASRAAAVAEAHGLKVMVGGVVELGIANAAGLHLAACMPELAAPSYLMGPLKYKRQITSPVISPSDSTLAVPHLPGLGVEVDEEALRELDARK